MATRAIHGMYGIAAGARALVESTRKRSTKRSALGWLLCMSTRGTWESLYGARKFLTPPWTHQSKGL